MIENFLILLIGPLPLLSLNVFIHATMLDAVLAGQLWE